jgi:HSP20 family protein
MNITRRQGSPLSTYRPASIDNQFGRLAENMFEDLVSRFLPYSGLSEQEQDGTAGPRMNVVETDKAFELEAEMPGVKKEDLRISIDNRRVMIEADVKRESEQKEGENIVYAERTARRYVRNITLPADVDDAAAQAKLENGVLMLTLPKKEPAQPKKITVQ